MMNRFINNYGANCSCQKAFRFIAQRCAGVVIDCASKVVINLSIDTRIQFHSSERSCEFMYVYVFLCVRLYMSTDALSVYMCTHCF